MSHGIYVNIFKGTHRNEFIHGVFPLHAVYKDSSAGGYITIKAAKRPPFSVSTPRIRVLPDDYYYQTEDGDELELEDVMRLMYPEDNKSAISTDVTNYEAKHAANETEEEAMVRIRETFAMMRDVVDATAHPDGIRGLVVSGLPGIGKSYEATEQLKETNMFRTIAGKAVEYEVISGVVRPLALYQKLYYNRKNTYVTIFDDCDSALYDDECLNMLKAALDSSKRRTISYLAESRVLKEEDIPNSFEFEGSIIFLTNIDFERTRISKIKDHLAAIMSRCHYLDLEITNTRDQMLRVRQVIEDGMFDNYNFHNGEANSILQYMTDNIQYLREISPRMAKKIADFVRMKPDNWVPFVESTCLTREAKFKRIIEEKDTE